MTVMARTDIHRPSSSDFDPEAYDCLGVFDLHPEDGNNRQRVELVRTLREGGYKLAAHQQARGSGQCGHCGAHIRYAALMAHEASMELIYVGETCLLGRFEALTKAEFQRLRQAAALNAERRRMADLATAQIACTEGLAEAVFVAGLPQVASNFVADVIAKLYQYGGLSPRQLAAVIPAAGRDLTRALAAATQVATPVSTDPVDVLLSDVARCVALGEFVVSVGEQFRSRGRISDRQRIAIQRVLDRPAPLEAGIYESPEGEIFKVQLPREHSGRPYAKVLIVNDNVRRLTEVDEVVSARYEYDSAAIHQVRAEWRVSLERAKELGHRTSTCIVCGARLDDAVSVREGIGPRCGGRR